MSVFQNFKELERRIAELEKDKARLDWVEDARNQVWEICISANPLEPSKIVHIDYNDEECLSERTWREAIDAAMNHTARAGERGGE